MKVRGGFTLIELLVVVAIIAILAAIAIPNMLVAQTRAKVARVKADLRTVTVGLESYRIDSNAYPLNVVYGVLPSELSTPVAYLSAGVLVDPFGDKLRDLAFGELARFYTYNRICSGDQVAYFNSIGRGPQKEAVDNAPNNLGAFKRYGQWRLLSYGPDRKYAISPAFPITPENPTAVLWGADVYYDPTNGVSSVGNILRTQLHGYDPIPSL